MAKMDLIVRLETVQLLAAGKSGKAFGEDLIPNEVYKLCPALWARVVHPLFCKAALRIEHPGLRTESLVLICTNCISLISAGALVALKVRYRARKDDDNTLGEDIAEFSLIPSVPVIDRTPDDDADPELRLLEALDRHLRAQQCCSDDLADRVPEEIRRAGRG